MQTALRSHDESKLTTLVDVDETGLPWDCRVVDFRRYLLICCTTLAACSAQSDEGRYQDYVVGARALGLGGAFTALSDDSSGIFYNPAGIVEGHRRSLSISTNLYGAELSGTSVVEDTLSRIESRAFSAADLIIVPSATGVVTGLGKPLPSGRFRHAFSFGTQVPSYSQRFVEERTVDSATGFDTRFRSSLIDRTLHVGAAYAFRAGPWFRMGVAAHYILRTVDAQESLSSMIRGSETPALASGTSEISSDSFLLADTRLRSTSHAVRLVFGALLKPGPRWTLGASLSTPSLGVWRAVTFQALDASADADVGAQPVQTVVRHDNSRIDLQSEQPLQGRIGIVFAQPASYTFSADVIVYGPSRYDVLPNETLNAVGGILSRVPIPLRIRRRPIANVNVGIEKLILPTISISLGMFTNFSAAYPLQLDEKNRFLRPTSTRLSNVNMLGGSLALGYFGKNALSRVGITGSAGFGRVVSPSAPVDRLSGSKPPLQATAQTQAFIYVFWSSTFRYGRTGENGTYGL